MKKLNIILGTFLFAVLLLTSCKDESGEFAEQLYTNAQKETAIRACLRASADTAVAHLFTKDGFYGDDDYRIDFPVLQPSLFDTLENHGFGYLGDSLILYANRMAEDFGSQMKSALKAAIDSLDITNYDALINGEDYAITAYFELHKYLSLKSALQLPVSIRMGIFKVNSTWNEMMQRYVQYAAVPLNFDLQNYLVEQLLTATLTEMRIEEQLIRLDPDRHRTAEMDVFGK